jgi:hypothetical protein
MWVRTARCSKKKPNPPGSIAKVSQAISNPLTAKSCYYLGQSVGNRDAIDGPGSH